MAFELKQSFFEVANATLAKFWDSTGIQDLATNPGGYGGTNIASTAVTSVELVFTFDEQPTTPTTVNLVVAAGTVISGTKTDSLGVVTTLVLADYNIGVFPFPSANPVEFPSTFFVPSPVYSDQYVSISYTISDGVDEYNSTETWVLNKNSCCCLGTQWAKNKCDEKHVIQIQNAMNALQAQTNIGDYAEGRRTLTRLKKLCCGCGCPGCS